MAVTEDPVRVTQPSYLDWGAVGRSGNLRYLVGTVLILLIWFGGQAIVQAALSPILGMRLEPDGSFTAPSAAANLAFNLVSFLPFFVATPLIVRYLHKRPALTVVTPFLNLNWGLIAKGVGLWFLAAAITAVPATLMRSGDLRFQFDAGAFLVLLVIVAAFLIWQTTAEELFFRGYLLQWFGKGRWRNPVFLGILSGLLFTVPHLANPEVRGAAGTDFLLGFLAYFSGGFVWGFVSVRSGTIELAIGAHFVNNLVNVLFITVETSALGPTALFIDTAPSVTEAGVTGVLSAVLFALFTWRIRGDGAVRPLPTASAGPTPGLPRPA